MEIKEYREARKRKIESLEDLDRDVVRRIMNFLRQPATAKAAARHFDVPLKIVTQIAKEIGL